MTSIDEVIAQDNKRTERSIRKARDYTRAKTHDPIDRNYNRCKMLKVGDIIITGLESRYLASFDRHNYYLPACQRLMLGRIVAEVGGNIAELGTYEGFLTATLAWFLKHGRKKEFFKSKIKGLTFPITKGHVWTIDKEKCQLVQQILKGLKLTRFVTQCHGTTDYFAEKVFNKHFKFNLVIIDADHSYEACKRDFTLWSPKVTIGGYLAMDDVHLNSVDQVIQEMGPEWKLVNHLYLMKIFRRENK